MEYRSGKFGPDKSRRRSEPLLADETHFFRSLIENPRLTGAIAPSGPFLARAMARAAAGAREGLVVELGPGTGPVTRALVESGVARERLVLVEYDPGFCRLLAHRFAPARVVQGDAYDLPLALTEITDRPIAAIVSSLPLLNQPPSVRARLIEDAFEVMGAGGIFVQFTYGLRSPIPRQACVNRFSGHCGAPIWRNLPPARVWTYRADPAGLVVEPMLNRLRCEADRLGERWAEKKREAGHLIGLQRARMRDMLKKQAGRSLARAERRRRETLREPPEI